MIISLPMRMSTGRSAITRPTKVRSPSNRFVLPWEVMHRAPTWNHHTKNINSFKTMVKCSCFRGGSNEVKSHYQLKLMLIFLAPPSKCKQSCQKSQIHLQTLLSVASFSLTTMTKRANSHRTHWDLHYFVCSWSESAKISINLYQCMKKV